MKNFFPALLACLALSLAAGAQIKSDETLEFYPTYACDFGGGKVSVNIHGRIYKSEEDSSKRDLLVRLMAETADVEEDSPEYPLFRSRARLFLADNQGGKNIRVILGSEIVAMPETGGNGHLEKRIEMSRTVALSIFKKNMLRFVAVTEEGDGRKFSGEVRYIPPEGISVISDIDDTIKVSNVLDRKEMVRNTFAREFQAVPGMADRYRRWEERGAAFHYVSGSPWQLYGPMKEFMDGADFPQGSVHLKYFRIKDSSGLDFLMADQKEYKVGVISAIMDDFPRRSFVLVGDSGESDPEVYAEIVKKYGKRVRAVCIRDVKNPADAKDRFTSLFPARGLTRFILFSDPRELGGL